LICAQGKANKQKSNSQVCEGGQESNFRRNWPGQEIGTQIPGRCVVELVMAIKDTINLEAYK